MAMSPEHDLLMTELLKRAVRNIRLDVQRLDIKDVARELVTRQCNPHGKTCILQERLLCAKLKENPKLDGLTSWSEHDEMPAQRVEDEDLETELAQEFKNELPERVENELVQAVNSMLEDGANSSLPRRDCGEFGKLLQNNLD